MLLKPTELQFLLLDVLEGVDPDFPTMLVHDEGWFWQLPQGLVPADAEDVIDCMIEHIVDLEGQVLDLQRRAHLGDQVQTALQAQELLDQVDSAFLAVDKDSSIQIEVDFSV